MVSAKDQFNAVHIESTMYTIVARAMADVTGTEVELVFRAVHESVGHREASK